MRAPKLFLAAVLSSSMLLAACDSAEERAEAHFESGMEYLEAGDVDRALVEFRNVFQLNGLHKEARLTYARVVRERGELREAYAQYLLAAEQYPDEVEARLALSEMAIDDANWEEVTRHGTRAVELAPDDPAVQVIRIALDYRAGIMEGDEPARREAAREAAALLDEAPNTRFLRQMMIDDRIRANAIDDALSEIDAALEITPDDRELYRLKLNLLTRLERDAEVRALLEELVDRFPGEQTYRDTLIRWYVSRDDIDSAEAFLRDQIAGADDKSVDRLLLVQLLRESRGIEAALGELDAIIATGEDDTLFRSVRAAMRFDLGEIDTAIEELESILATAEPSDQTRDVKVSLAQIFDLQGNQVGARQRVEEVLAEDATHVEALKLRAGWLIADDDADAAIVALRTALDQAPQDPEIMTLMGQAHLRNGSRELAGELLALAAEASNSAPEESLRYGQFLFANENFATAETVLVEALRATPNNVEILALLGNVYIAQEDWSRTEQVEGTLGRIGSADATTAATGLRVARLQLQGRDEEALAFLETLAGSDRPLPAAEIAIVRTHFANGDFEAAEDFVTASLERNPDRPAMRFLLGSVYGATDRADEAAAIYRSLLDENPRDEIVWRALYMLQIRAGQDDAARETLDAALTAMPGSANLLWALASDLENSGDIDGSIDVYRQIYAQNSNSTVVANNLASLLATYRDDEASLEEAFQIARRLRGIEVPAFQDTYGWIAYRRGLIDDALEHLEPAAAALAGDPVVQYHYAMALAAAERYDDALAQFRVALSVAGEDDPRPQFATARAEMDRIAALIEAGSAN